MFSNTKPGKLSWSSAKSLKSCHDVSSSDSDATIDPGSDAASDSDATVEPDPQDFNSSDTSADEKDILATMASKVARQTTHVISDSGSDSETDVKSSSKKRNNSHKSSNSSSSSKSDHKKTSSSHHHRESNNRSSHDSKNGHSKGHSHRNPSSKSSSSSLTKQKPEKPSKSVVSSNGSDLFSDFLDLSSESTKATPAKSLSVTSAPAKSPTQKSTKSKKSLTLHDIFGSDSDENGKEEEKEVIPRTPSPDPNDLVPQPTSPSPPQLSPSPPSSPGSSKGSSPGSPPADMSFEKALDSGASRPAKSKPSSDAKPSLSKSSPNRVPKSEPLRADPVSRYSPLASPSSDSSLKKESVKIVPKKEPSTPNENKRKHPGNNNSSSSKPMCEYGSNCTRKNPLHWAEYEHFEENCGEGPLPKKQKSLDPKSSETLSAIRRKYREAQPFSFFLTQVKGIDTQHNSSFALDISEILSPAFGDLQASCQFNYMIDINWLVQQYSPEFRKKPLLIVHGFAGSEQKGLQQDASKFSNITLCQAQLDIPFGTHHSKMMFLLYDNGMRVVIHTANLIHGDWHQKTQALWVSPLFPKLKGGANKNEGHSPTSFKKDLLQYVAAYKKSALSVWERHLLEHDMSAAKVHLIASVPGRHMMLQKNAWGHLKLRKVLIDNGPEKMEVESWPVIGQFSSIGSLGPSADKWLCAEFYQSLAACRTNDFSTPHPKNLKLIYPTVDNVRVSLEGYPAGTCLPYSIQTAKKQSYLVKFLHHWRSEGRGRTRACPHIKTYMRASPDSSMAAWFIVTSANLSKAAWGVLEKNGSQLMIRSYEIGVMFIPNLFDMRRLKLTTNPKEMNQSEKSLFLLPYDVPLTRYENDDAPWIYDLPYKDLPDSNGMMWCPTAF